MNNRISRALPAALALTLCAAFTPSASAAESYLPQIDGMTGAQCQPSWGNQWADFVVNPDGIRNVSDVQRYISCTGITRMMSAVDMSNVSGTSPSAAFFLDLTFDYSQVAAGPALSTPCTIFIRNMYTGTTRSVTVSVSSSRTTTPVLGTFTPTEFNGMNVNAWDMYSFNCRLPPKVKLTSISAITFGDTGGWRYTP